MLRWRRRRLRRRLRRRRGLRAGRGAPHVAGPYTGIGGEEESRNKTDEKGGRSNLDWGLEGAERECGLDLREQGARAKAQREALSRR